jgi:hypothetical protein
VIRLEAKRLGLLDGSNSSTTIKHRYAGAIMQKNSQFRNAETKWALKVVQGWFSRARIDNRHKLQRAKKEGTTAGNHQTALLPLLL